MDELYESDEDRHDHEMNDEIREYERSITRHKDGMVTNWNIAYNGERLL